MDLANQVIMQSTIPDLLLAKPVVRHGDKPDIEEFTDLPSLAQSLIEISRSHDHQKSIDPLVS